MVRRKIKKLLRSKTLRDLGGGTSKKASMAKKASVAGRSFYGPGGIQKKRKKRARIR